METTLKIEGMMCPHCEARVKSVLEAFPGVSAEVSHKKGYAKFCHENGFQSSSKKSCSTTAQSVYGFITDNAEYIEEHTALSDALIEMEIFVRCLKTKKKFHKNIHQWDAKGKEFNKCFPKWAE